MRRAIIAAVLLGAFALVSFAQPLRDADTGFDAADPDAARPSRPAAIIPTPVKTVPFAATDAMPSPSIAPPTAPVQPSPARANPTDPDAPTAVTSLEPMPPAPSPALEPVRPREAVVSAKTIFGSLATPAPLAARSIGFYSRGCLAGAVPMAIDGETWQVMRLSRNRNWGHPRLISLLERLAEDVAAKDGWQGLLLGDISQPRGGPMPSDHNSHQIGLDADIWLTPMPDRRLSAWERETLEATPMLGPDGVHANPEAFTPYHAALIRRAASYPEVERILIHPGIKKAMCDEPGVDHSSFHKIRPFWGHTWHMHVRIGCPPNSDGCKGQAPPPGDDGCGAEITDWLARVKRAGRPVEPPPLQEVSGPRIDAHPVMLADLPSDCRAVVMANGTEVFGPRSRNRNMHARAAKSGR